MVTPCRLASSSTTSRLETAPANLGGGDTAADLWIKKGTAGATALDATALDAEATAIADGQRSDQYITMVGIGGKNHRRQTGRANYKIRSLDEGGTARSEFTHLTQVHDPTYENRSMRALAALKAHVCRSELVLVEQCRHATHQRTVAGKRYCSAVSTRPA